MKLKQKIYLLVAVVSFIIAFCVEYFGF